VQDILEEGNKRFRNGQPLTRDLDRLRHATTEDQHPLAIVLSGTSSRTPIEMIFDVGIGDIFCARATGNFAGDGVLGSLEYATALAGAKLIVVLGHTRNNAAKMAVDLLAAHRSAADACDCPHLDPILTDIQKSVDRTVLAHWNDWTESEKFDYVDELSKTHVLRTVRHVFETSPAVRRCVEEGQVKITGAMYDVRNGQVTFLDESGGTSELVTSAGRQLRDE
jgi:carbonic anhydrase/SulP family sulfate permease